MISYKKDIKHSDAKYMIIEDKLVKSNGGGQWSYNIPVDFFDDLKEKEILIKQSTDSSRQKIDGDGYVIDEKYTFQLGSGTLWIIGEEFKKKNNKFIIFRSGTNNKCILYKTVYKELGEDYEWFVKLYDNNLKGNDIILEVDEKEKTVTFDVRFNAIEKKVSEESIDDTYKDVNYPCNWIFFGAPGTGKSFNLNKEKKHLLKTYKKNYERITFHPDYSYAHFVGTYKPVPKKDDETIISYKYVPGPFMRILSKALMSPNEPFLLIIEEINRANVAAVFGDVFQLLDRDDDGNSEFPIQTSEDMKKYLMDEMDVDEEVCETISIPSNLFIWATMNSADQGVYVMDTAFKRRWDFNYIDINNSEEKIKDAKITWKVKNKNNDEDNNKTINWNILRKSINRKMLKFEINEDKLIGPFFIPLKYINNNSGNNGEELKEIFKNKVLMYLFEDIAKSGKRALFSNEIINQGYNFTYSNICKQFDEKGIDIFCDDIKRYYEACYNQSGD